MRKKTVYKKIENFYWKAGRVKASEKESEFWYLKFSVDKYWEKYMICYRRTLSNQIMTLNSK